MREETRSLSENKFSIREFKVTHDKFGNPTTRQNEVSFDEHGDCRLPAISDSMLLSD